MKMFRRRHYYLILIVFLFSNSYAKEQINHEDKSMTVLQQAWNEYYQRIDKMRALTEASAGFQNPANRPKAYHALIEAQAMAYNLAMASRSHPPLIQTRAWYADVFTLGGNSPDFYYGALFLDGSKTYKITGNFGELKLVIAQVFSHLMGHPESKMLSNFEFNDAEIADDGSFEVIASAEKHEGNWIPLDPSSKNNFLFIRRAFEDWNVDLGDLKVTLQGEPSFYDEVDPELQAERIMLAADFMEFLVTQWNIGIYDLYLNVNEGKKNVVKIVPGSTIAQEKMGSPSTSYVWGVYDIKEDEALIIEQDVPEAKYWSYQLFDVWCKPLDFVNHQTDVNMNRAHIDSDGKWRLVISAKDPGVANWLDPAGRLEGTIVGRNYLATQLPEQVEVKLVKASEILDHLPDDTKKVTPEERQKALEYRRQSYLRMHHEIK
jgi:hypothetical protein